MPLANCCTFCVDIPRMSFPLIFLPAHFPLRLRPTPKAQKRGEFGRKEKSLNKKIGRCLGQFSVLNWDHVFSSFFFCVPNGTHVCVCGGQIQVVSCCVMCVIDFWPRKWDIMPEDMKFIKIDCKIIQWRCWKANFDGKGCASGLDFSGWVDFSTARVYLCGFSFVGCWTFRSDVVCRIFCRVKDVCQFYGYWPRKMEC